MLNHDRHRSKKQLLLQKFSINRKHEVLQKLEERDAQFINSNGIVTPGKLILIACLIILSISTLLRANSTHWPHVKALTNYFSYYALGQTQLSIYDRGNNVDQTYIEITTYSDMKDHLQNLVNFVQNYTVNGFADFSRSDQQSVDLEFYYTNGTSDKLALSFEQFKQTILHSDIRQLLLSLRVLYFQISFGDNDLINDFKLVLDYEIYSHSMLYLDMSTKYKAKTLDGALKAQFLLRNLQRLFAALLLIAYSVEARKIYYSEQLQKVFRKNSLYWCCSLIMLNFVAIISNTLAPMCAMMQLLPVFENYDSSNTLTYNFNVNLRYALPIVFRIIVPVYIILSGFILYSMLMYPGQYFDDYITGFFSYFYNNFQYGIYQIFIQIRSRGNFAYLLYGILYFYMVLVGSNLIPALFCTLIYQKMAEKQLVRYFQTKLQLLVCPSCHQQNYNKNNYGLQISINSPKSPYLKSGTTLKHSHEMKDKMTKMYIGDSEDHLKSPTLSPILSLKNKHKRARDLVTQLTGTVQQSMKIGPGESWIRARLQKIQSCLSQFQNVKV